VGETPCAGAPDGLPFLQTTSLVPNAPVDASPLLALFDVVVVSELDSLSLRPQAATTSAMTHRNANHRKRFTSPPLRRASDLCCI
jgi:hypothetical protein